MLLHVIFGFASFFRSLVKTTFGGKDTCHFYLLDCEIAGMGTVATGAYRVS